MAFDTLATRKNAKLRLALTGPAGTGKTHGSLLFAKVFGKKIGLMDSERGSSKKVVGLPGIPPFYPEYLEEKNVQEYLEKIADAAAAGVDVLVIDSYSHSWLAALDTVDKMGGNKFTNGWKTVSPLVTKLVDAILAYPGHVVATMRSKSDFVTEDVNGKKVPRKIGMATVARDGTDFEFDVVLALGTDQTITVEKTRCHDLPMGEIYPRADLAKLAERLRAWLDEGAPESASDQFANRIRFAQSSEALSDVVGEIHAALRGGTVTREEATKLKPMILGKKAELEADA